MTGLEMNVFPIENLGDLASEYRLYRIRGLRKDQVEYHQNKQILIRKLSYGLRSPVTIIERNGEAHLVLRVDASEPPSPFPVVRATVLFERVVGSMQLDYRARSPENDEICLRFLQFMLQNPLTNSPSLWQPGSGKPFFEKRPVDEYGGVQRFSGFVVRAVVTPDGGMGLCVDLRTKYVGSQPLPMHATREAFRKWKGHHCVYHYGHSWYDIRVEELADLTVSQMLVPYQGRQVSLLDFITANSQKPLPQELASLPHDASVVHYSNNKRESRAAPAALCYPVFDTQSDQVKRNHGRAIARPEQRRAAIFRFVNGYLRQLRFGGLMLKVGAKPLTVPTRMFQVPDIEFGNSRILSVRGTGNTQHVGLDNLGKTRAALLRDKGAGFFVTDPLDRQYLMLPQSVADSFGEQYRHDLADAVDELFPQERGYDPTLVTYNDRGPRTFLDQGQAVLAAARQHCTKPGYALVMVHETRGSRIREHDQLAAMVIRELRKLDVCAAVNHSTMAQDAYALVQSRNGSPRYEIRHASRGKFSGYMRNVALNKILLTSERWPFVLATRLHADVTVGIDVKDNTAGFTIVAARGTIIRTQCSESRQRERLLAPQVKKYLMELVAKEREHLTEPVRHVVIHRDGRLWESEREGAKQAMAALKEQRVVAADASLSLLEIGKSSLIPARFFEVTGGNGQGSPGIDNPQVGTFHILQGRDGYLCATGRAFPRQGTVQPLHVRYVEGELSFEACLEDLYLLTTLAWTRPEDCTRYPITLKLTDRRLGEEATDYDADALEFLEADAGVEEEVA